MVPGIKYKKYKVIYVPCHVCGGAFVGKMETVGYCLRVDARDGYCEKIVSLSHFSYDAVIAVRHKGATGENPHYHLVIRTDVKPQAFRVRMKNIFTDGKGNGHMSIKAWDGNNDAISYLFHEDPEAQLIVRKGITDELIDRCKERNARVQEAIKEAKKSASHTLEDQVYELISSGQVKINCIYDEQFELEVAKQVLLTAFRSNKYPPNDWLLRSITGKIVFRLKEGDVEKEERYCENIVKRVYRVG